MCIPPRSQEMDSLRVPGLKEAAGSGHLVFSVELYWAIWLVVLQDISLLIDYRTVEHLKTWSNFGLRKQSKTPQGRHELLY